MPSIKIIIDRFTEDSAILITESGKQILWPKDKLPDTFQPGQTFYLTLTNKPDNNIQTTPKDQTSSNPEQDHQKLAKAILKEILNTNE